MRWERTADVAAEATAERVWAVLLDGRRWSEWNPGIAWMTVEGPLVAGGIVTMKPRRAPQTALRIEAVVPPRLLALVLTIGPLATLRVRWELAPTDGATAIVATVAIDGPLAGPLLRRTAERIANGMPATLRRLAECARSESA